MQDLDDLLDFLHDRRDDVRQMAVDIVKGLTGSPEGIDQLKGQLGKLLLSLLRLVGDRITGVSGGALTSLVNLSQDPSAVSELLRLNVVGRVMDYIRERDSPHTGLLVMLLANITISQEGAEQLLQLGQAKLAGLHCAMLLQLFTVSAVTLSPGEADPFEHVAAILVNVTRLQRGRELLLQPGRGLLQALASQLQAPSLVRRRGVAGAIRNCFISAEQDGTLEAVLSDEAVLQRLVRPLSGEEPREADDLVREVLAESIQVLARSEAGRKALWKVDTPELLKKGYEQEEHPGVCAAMEAAARDFMFEGMAEVEEEPGAEGTEGAEVEERKGLLPSATVEEL